MARNGQKAFCTADTCNVKKKRQVKKHTLKPYVIVIEIKTIKMNTRSLGEQNNIRYIKRIRTPDGKFTGVQLATTILRGEKERRKASKDAGALEAKNAWQVGKITVGKEQNTQNRTECLLPAEH